MSRFYNTSPGAQVGFVKPLNEELMLGLAEQINANLESQYGTLDLLEQGLGKIEFLKKDEDFVKGKVGTYQKEMDDITALIDENPMEYLSQKRRIKNLARRINSDVNSGELGNVQSNARSLKEWEKSHKKMLQEGKIDQTTYNAAKSKYLNDFKGSYQDGVFSPIQVKQLVAKQNAMEIADKAVAKIKANSTKQRTVKSSEDGKWIEEYQVDNRWITEADVAAVAMDALLGNDDLTNYIRQQKELGLENREMINPVSFEKVMVDGEETQRINYDDNSVYSSAVRKAINTYSFSEQVNEVDIKANDYAKIHYSDQKARERAANKYNRDMAKIDKRHANALERDKIKQSYKDKAEKGKDLSSVSGTAMSQTYKPYGDGKFRPNTVKAHTSVLEDMIKSIDNEIEEGNLTSDVRKVKLNQKEGIYNKIRHNDRVLRNANTYAYDNLSSEEMEIYDKYFELDGTPTEEYKKLKEEVKREEIDNAMKSANSSIYTLKRPYYDNMSKINKVFEKRDKNQEKWFKNNVDQSEVKLNGIVLEDKDKEVIFQSIKLNKDNFDILDPSVGETTNTAEFISNTGEGLFNTQKKSHLTFKTEDNRGDKIQGLYSYLDKEGKELSDVMEIININSPGGGMGTTATVRFNLHGIDNTKNFLITLPNSVSESIAEEYLQSDNPSVRSLANDIVGMTRGNFISDFQKAMSSGSDEFETTLPMGSNKQINAKIERVGGELKLSVKSAGEYQEVGRTFKNINALANYYFGNNE